MLLIKLAHLLENVSFQNIFAGLIVWNGFEGDKGYEIENIKKWYQIGTLIEFLESGAGVKENVNFDHLYSFTVTLVVLYLAYSQYFTVLVYCDQAFTS